MASFLGELKRRKVFQVAAVYAVVAWLLVQIVVTVEGPLSLPGWFDTVIIVFLAVGFPVAVILSWAYELTPTGVVRDTGPSASAQTRSHKLEYALVVLVVLMAAWIVVRETRVPPTLPNSVAILPFENLSAAPENEFFAVGIHDTILSELTGIADLNVIGRASVSRYDANIPPSQIAQELNVEAVMRGTVQYADDQVRITLQLIDADSESSLWAENYDRRFSDIFVIQSEIARAVAAALQAELLPGEQDRIAAPLAASADAYSAYLQAVPFLRSGLRGDSREAALRYLSVAIQRDPNFALAYGQRAHLYSELAINEANPARREEFFRLTRADAEKALDIGVAHVALAEIYENSWRAREAQTAFQRALELSPHDAEVLREYALFRAELGQFDEAIRLAEAGVRLDPYAPIQTDTLGRIFLMAGDFDSARQTFLSNSDRGVFGQLRLIANELARGDNQAALQELTALEQYEPVNALSLSEGLLAHLAYLYGRLDRDEDLERISRILEQTCRGRPCPLERALTYLARSDQSRVLDAINEAIELRDAGRFEAVSFGLAMELSANIWRDQTLETPECLEARRRLALTLN